MDFPNTCLLFIVSNFCVTTTAMTMLVMETTMVTATTTMMVMVMVDGSCDYNDNGDVIVMDVAMALVVAASSLVVTMISMTVIVDHQERIVLD